MTGNNLNDKGAWKEDLRLYVHVPFCVKKCSYCDFLSSPSDEKGIGSYFEALYKEIRSYKDRVGNYTVSSVFIGGGTPSCVDSAYIVATLKELQNVFEFTTEVVPEITIEVNPGTIEISSSSGKVDVSSDNKALNLGKIKPISSHKNKLIDYKSAGINRLSFGLQSTHDHELRLLGRIHSYSQFKENYALAREVGFNNINIDLMSALPGQSVKSWEETLVKIAELKPEHISAYSLIIEEGTPFYKAYGPEGRERNKLPSEENDRLIYSRTKEILLSYGYKRYEISNYAKEGFECRHNMAYWEGVSYLGLGLGSSSLIENTRFNNTDSLDKYLTLINDEHKNIMSTTHNKTAKNEILSDFNGIRNNIISLTKNQLIEEFMYLGLRKTEGVSKSNFMNLFGISLDDIYNKQLNILSKEGLITNENDLIRLTDYGIDVSNRVLVEFLLD